jgi:hypothetical protein
MDRSEIIPMPDNFEMDSQASHCLTQLQELDYSEQITVLRDLVAPMGISVTTAT